MNEYEITKQIYKLVKSGSERGIEILQIIELCKDKDISKIIAIYKNILDGKVKIVTISSKIEIDKSQKETLEKKLKGNFSTFELIFDYDVSDRNSAGVMIKIDDNIMDGTV